MSTKETTRFSEADPRTGQPVGKIVNAWPASPPGPVMLIGNFGHVEKLDAAHAPGLWEVLRGADPVWTYMGYGPFAEEAAFMEWVPQRAALNDPYAYAVIDGESQRAVGILTLMEIRPAMRVVEVGHVVHSPAMQRTPLATEAHFLLARYVFESLGYRRYEWKCNALNEPSNRAAERFGFTYEGVFRQHMIVKGRNRDTAWYSMLDSEWPVRKQAYERWLAPDNFDESGAQKTSLRAFIGAPA